MTHKERVKFINFNFYILFLSTKKQPPYHIKLFYHSQPLPTQQYIETKMSRQFDPLDAPDNLLLSQENKIVIPNPKKKI